MTDVLIVGDTVRSPELRHEVPVSIGDPFIYVERSGARYVFVGSLEIPRLEHVDSLVVSPLEELGLDELVAAGLRRDELELELVLRACTALGVEEAATPRSFPLETADHLRARGISLRPDGELFDRRRRRKTESEIAGIRRAQRACELAMDAIRAELTGSPEPSSQSARARALDAFNGAGVLVPDLPIVSHGAQTAVGHDPGGGAIGEGEPIIVDLFPQDPESGCFADMTRTFCLGAPPPELVEYQRLCREALELVYPAVRPGVRGRDLFDLVCDHFEAAGHATQRTKSPGTVLDHGFFHSLGHGVGLEVHEEPGLGRLGFEELAPGDVVAVEPGLYRTGFGGCRLEDLVLVTEQGCEVLTAYPYELAP